VESRDQEVILGLTEVMDVEVDAQLRDLDQNLSQIIDPETLKAQINNTKKLNYNDLSKLQQRDYEITQELEQLRELWVVATLIKEVEVNLELYEFENVFDSLKNFKKKIKSDAFSSNLVIIDKLQDEHDRYHERAISQIEESWKKLIDVKEDSVTFNAEVEINGNIILLENILDVIKSNNLQSRISNSNITHLIDQKLLTALIQSKSLQLSDNIVTIIDSKPTIQDQIQSVENLANFISFIPDDQQIINYISPRLFEWLKEIITSNIDTVYSDKALQNQFLKLGSLLSEKHFKRNDLQNWIQNELNEIAVEHYLDTHIDQVRQLIRKVDKSVFQNLITRTYQEKSENREQVNPEPQTKPSKPISTVSAAATADSDDGDEEWDAWNDEEIEIDDDEPSQSQQPEVQQSQEDEDNDDWDWNDDDDEEEEAESSKRKRKLVSKLVKKEHSNNTSLESTPQPQHSTSTSPSSTYQTTLLPDEFHKIIKSYLSTQSRLPSEYHDLHYSKLNYLITGYFILVSQEFKNHSTSSLLLYNDLTYLMQITNIPRLIELKENYLDNFIKDFQNEIDEHYSKLHGLNPAISSSETYSIIDDIQLVFTMFFKKLSMLPSWKYDEFVGSIVENFYGKIIASVFDKYDIGEVESEYLNLILNKFLTLKFPIEHSKIKNHSKLGHVTFIVNSHLKDIMENFYNAEFFDLSTMELIALIDKLFADSDLKRRSIEDIREIREAE